MKADHTSGVLKLFMIFLLGCPLYAQQVIFSRGQPPKGKTAFHRIRQEYGLEKKEGGRYVFGELKRKKQNLQ